MARPFPLSFRRRTAVLAGAVLAVSTLSGAASAQATPNVTDLEATVLRLGGPAVTGSTAIPAGRTLTPVHLTTADPVTWGMDGWTFTVATPGFRFRGATIPGRPAEEATFRINGQVVATTVPEFRFTTLQTDAGPLPADMFTANGVTYAFPSVPIGEATRTVARSTVGNPVIGFGTYQRGMLPIGAQTRVGTAFAQGTQTSQPVGTGATTVQTVVDADNIRRNGAQGEELLFDGEPAFSYRILRGTEGTEELATVRLRNGATVAVRSVRFSTAGSFGFGSATWLFDRAALADAGATIADVTSVVSSVPSAHSLTWQDLGFDLA